MKNRPHDYPDLALHIALENLKGFVRKSNEADEVTGKTTDAPSRPSRAASTPLTRSASKGN